MIPNLKVEIIEPVLCKGFPREADFKALDNLATAIVEKHKDNSNSAFSGTVAYADITLTHARLARIARKLGDNDLAQKHIQAATVSCRRTRWEDCSEMHILAVSKRLEQENPIKCLATEY